MASQGSGELNRRPESGSRGKVGPREAISAAVSQFAELTGRESCSVTGVRDSDGGWSVLIDVVELDRIPASTSVMATYRVDTDAEGRLSGYERLRRYHKGATDPP